MFSTIQTKMLQPRTYTPEQAAEILQLSKNTVYDLIGRGELVAKKIGKVYRIPQSSLSFVFTGMDADILAAQKQDEENLAKVDKTLREVREDLWKKSKSF
jgi:excisionase family DNA binding protein